MSFLFGFIKGLFQILFVGFGIAIVLFLLLSAIGNAIADEAVRPARLGEQNRTLNYVSPTVIVVEEVVVYEYIPITRDCATRNAHRVATLEMIAKRIAAKPHLGYIWKQAILSIQSSWCNE